MLGEDFPVWLLGVPCAPDSNPSATLCNRAQSVHLFLRWNCTLVCLGTLLGGWLDVGYISPGKEFLKHIMKETWYWHQAICLH